MDAFKHLVESGMLSEQVKTEIEKAFVQKIQENRELVTAELREEFAEKYNHDKEIMIEALDKMLSERLKAELTEFNEDKKQLHKEKVQYRKNMKESAKALESFVMNQLSKELREFTGDRSKVVENVKNLEKFIVENLAKEIHDFHKDKKDLAETKVRLVAGAKDKLDELKSQFIKRAAKSVEETVTKSLQKEMSQLKEDIDAARTNNFGRRIFEAFAQEYQISYLNEKSDTARLVKIVNKKDKELAEAATKLQSVNKLVESKEKELKIQKDIMKRSSVMEELLAPLNANKKNIMRELLESVETNRLANAFDKYLPAVMEGEISRKPKANVLQESKAVSGDKKSSTSAVGIDNIVDIRRLAGLK